MAKKRKEVDVDSLDFKDVLEEAVATGKLGRMTASFGAKLCSRERKNAEFVYYLLKAKKELPKSIATASILQEKKTKKYSPSEAIAWFAKKYPREAEPLLTKLQEEGDVVENAVEYGLHSGNNFPDSYYVRVLEDILEIPQQDAAIMYHGVLKPALSRMEEKEGLVRIVMK